jgi:Uma2 family endonuclease
MVRPDPQQKRLTAEEFAQLSFEGKVELIDGYIVREAEVPGAKHGHVAANIAFELRAWTRQSGGGIVLVEAGYIIQRQPDRVRLPDVSFVRGPGTVDLPEGYFERAPDLAVEIVSPNDKAGDLEEKLEDYRQIAVPMVWVVFPATRTVIAHTADGLARIHRGADVIHGGEVLPGFERPITSFFE